MFQVNISKQICARATFRAAVSIIGIFVSGFGSGLFAQEQSVPDAQMIMFTPSDVEPPPREEYQKRLQQYGEYAEEFFNHGLKHWGHEPTRKEIFNRDQDGEISVIHIISDYPAKDVKKEWISKQVPEKLRTEHKIKPYGQLYWIFVYVGDPPKKSGAFRGAGNTKTGGWGVVNYTNLPVEISTDDDLVSTAHHKVLLKGCLHEFGHGLGLPHIGPKIRLKMGNTMMGPTTKMYLKQNGPHKTKGYLSEGSAAILSAHPIFTGNTESRGLLPATKFEETDVKYDRKKHTIEVTGKLQDTTLKPHRIVVIDNRDDKPGAYWVRSFVSQVDEDSQFSISIPEPNRSGKIKILVVYENGAFTGNGKNRGIGSATEIPYSFN